MRHEASATAFSIAIVLGQSPPCLLGLRHGFQLATSSPVQALVRGWVCSRAVLLRIAVWMTVSEICDVPAYITVMQVGALEGGIGHQQRGVDE